MFRRHTLDAGLAEAYLVSTFYGRGSAREFYDKARSAAERAIQLDEGSFQAHATLGLVKSSYLQAGAAADFQRALQLNPSYATAHHWYAFDLWRTGRHEDALAELDRARQLDPVSPIINTDSGVFLISAGQTEEAVRAAAAHHRVGAGFFRSAPGAGDRICATKKLFRRDRGGGESRCSESE